MVEISQWKKFKILLWKNFILQWHRKMQMIINIIIPLLMVGALVLIRSFVLPTSHPAKDYPQLYLNNINTLRFFHLSQMELNWNVQAFTKIRNVKTPGMYGLKFQLLFTPPNPLLEEIVRKTAAQLFLTNPGYRAFHDSKKFEKELEQGNYLAGIQFDESLKNITEYPKTLKYTLRFPVLLRTNVFNTYTWYTTRLIPPRDDTGPRNAGFPDGGLPAGYYNEGFLAIQHIIATIFIQLASGKSIAIPSILLCRYPDPPFRQDTLVGIITTYMPLFIMLSYMQLCMGMVKEIAIEKEKQLKEVMKVLGLHNSLHWSAWFTKSIIIFALISIVVTMMLTVHFFDNVGVLTYSDPFVIYLILLVYCACCICSSFMFAVFFSKAGTASSVIVIFFFLTYFPYTFLNHQFSQLSLAKKLGWSLFSNTAMGFAFQLILIFESQGVGIQFNNIFKGPTFEEKLTVGFVLMMMLFSCVLYMIICLYVEKIFPGNYGVPYPWNFPFQTKYWQKRTSHDIINDLRYYIKEERNEEHFEKIQTDKLVTVEAIGLKKKYNKKWVVSNFSLELYKDEITVLLGHNGAGKTTTISMLAGMCKMTSGTVYINGYNLRDNTNEARLSMGIVLQHNVLFDDLTVVEHLRFFSMVKGLQGTDVDDQVNYYMEKINLVPKANVAAKNLSGGMKRKLCLICALCGNSDIILLDEPSEGLDPLARRQVWDLLQKEKLGRTILLSTQLLDEADVLADRVVIITSGRMVAYGTPYFLKKNFSIGIYLVCAKNEECNDDEVTELLSRYIENAMPVSVTLTEITYRLPEKYSSDFSRLFRDLENRADELKLSGYGIRATSLQDVFMQVGNEEPESRRSSNKPCKYIFNEGSEFLTGYALMANQWEALLLKKLLNSVRRWMLIIIQFLLPIYFVFISILVAQSIDLGSDAKDITISLSQYPSAIAVIAMNEKANDLENDVAGHYQNIVQSYGNNFKVVYTRNQNFSAYMKDVSKKSKNSDNTDHLVGATIDKNRMIAWLNNELLHTAPLTLNLLHNALAKHFLGDEAKITVTNHPVSTHVGALFLRVTESRQLGVLLTINLCMCLSFALAFYILFIVTERHTRAKLLQFISGVHIWPFWLTHFLWDYLMFTTTVVTALTVLYSNDSDCCTKFENIVNIFLFMMLFGASVLMMIYVFSFLFNDPATAFLYASAVSILLGVIPFLTTFMLKYIAKNFVSVATRIFYMVPHFSFAHGMINLYTNILNREICEDEQLTSIPAKFQCKIFPACCDSVGFWAMSKPGILEETLYMLGTGICFLIILIVIDTGLVNKIKATWQNRKVHPPPQVDEDDIDSDVLAEANLIRNMSQEEKKTKLILLDSVTKYYGKFLAVNQVSVVIKRKECFGLLGINGAGKTTTFNLMTGDEAISYGDAYMNGINLRTNRRKIKKNYGYCPQFDALFDLFTIRETIHIFALLNGIHRSHTHEILNELSYLFNFDPYLDMSIKNCSAGIKRKLSTAIALIGSPPVLFLDEPTSAMDPIARQQILFVLTKMRDSGKSLVLTSHVLDECEGLCTRLVIMVNGTFKCMGSVQHIKSKFSKGLTLKIIARTAKVKPKVSSFNVQSLLGQVSKEALDDTTDKIKKYMEEAFPDATLQSELQSQLTYYVQKNVITLSELFGELEKHRTDLNIEDYTINQTSLEDIFLEFASEQIEEYIDVTSAPR